ncbi:hypothetical protein [Mycobacterium colombiense]|nr:hypothetical protein [Mycobacterium colombiense]
MSIKVALEHRTSHTFDRLAPVTDVGAPGILDLRRVRTVAQ